MYYFTLNEYYWLIVVNFMHFYYTYQITVDTLSLCRPFLSDTLINNLNWLNPAFWKCCSFISNSKFANIFYWLSSCTIASLTVLRTQKSRIFFKFGKSSFKLVNCKILIKLLFFLSFIIAFQKHWLSKHLWSLQKSTELTWWHCIQLSSTVLSYSQF